MRRLHRPLLILFLVISHSAAGQDAAHRASGLKSIELADTYKIQVPSDLEADRVSDKVSADPSYVLRNYHPPYTWIEVMVLPYSVARDYGLVAVDEETGLFTVPFSINGLNPLTAYFKMSGGQYAYYGWITEDMAYACTMNSPCPHGTERNSRYRTLYHFVVFDKANNSIVEFTGYYSGASKRVEGFHGDGKLLREVIVPSLAPIR
jgi:hypothetical protein